MIVSLQVQHAVHHQVGVMRFDALALRSRFAAYHRRAQRDVAVIRCLLRIGERQHVGRVMASAKTAVQRLALDFIDQPQRYFGVALQRGTGPAAQLRARRRIIRMDSELHCQTDLRFPCGAVLRVSGKH